MTVDATSQDELSSETASGERRDSSERTSEVKTAATSLSGELRRPPRSAFWTFVLGATGLLVLGHAISAVARLTMGIRRPASLEVTSSGIRIEQKTLVLGRVIRDRRTVVPLEALLRVTREVRFARTGLYAGLAMLALGTYFGIGLFVDGLRAPGGSPSLLFMGLVIMLVGLVLDFGLSSLADTARGRCQITVVPVRGRPVCVGALEPRQADRALRIVAAELGIEPEHPEADPPQLLDQLGTLAERARQTFDNSEHDAMPSNGPPSRSQRRDASDANIEAAQRTEATAPLAEPSEAERAPANGEGPTAPGEGDASDPGVDTEEEEEAGAADASENTAARPADTAASEAASSEEHEGDPAPPANPDATPGSDSPVKAAAAQPSARTNETGRDSSDGDSSDNDPTDRENDGDNDQEPS